MRKNTNFHISVISNNYSDSNYNDIIFDTGHKLATTKLEFRFSHKDSLENNMKTNSL